MTIPNIRLAGTKARAGTPGLKPRAGEPRESEPDRVAVSSMRRYLFKLYPTAPQAAHLHEHRQMMADLWNALKQRREDVYRRERKSLTFFDLTNEITTLRHECPEWAAIPAITAHRVAKQLTDAYVAFFRRVKSGEAPGYPRWQRRDRATTIPLGTMGKTGWRIEQRGDNPLSWSLHYGGVSNVRDRATWIHARGRMPARRLDTESCTSSVGLPRALGQRARHSSSSPTTHASLRRDRAQNGVTISDWRNADIIWRDGNWWLSVCVNIEPRRLPASRIAGGVTECPTRIEFDLIDGFARVNGYAAPVPGLAEIHLLQDQVDAMKSERDLQWPRGTRPAGSEAGGMRCRLAGTTAREGPELDGSNAAISKLSARIARKRKDALHVWTTRIVEQAGSITIVAPPVRQMTKTPRGDEKRWGANIEVVSNLNRNTLSQAPAMAIQMIRYKAEEAGIRCDVIEDDSPKIAVGGDLVSAGKTLRRARRELRRAA